MNVVFWFLLNIYDKKTSRCKFVAHHRGAKLHSRLLQKDAELPRRTDWRVYCRPATANSLTSRHCQQLDPCIAELPPSTACVVYCRTGQVLRNGLTRVLHCQQRATHVCITETPATLQLLQVTNSVFCFVLLPGGSGPIPEVLQYRANPWRSRSKLLHLLPVPKISLISKFPSGERIRY